MNSLPLKYYSKKELAALYGITVKVLLREVVDAKIFRIESYKKRKLLSPKEVKKIFEALGEPLL